MSAMKQGADPALNEVHVVEWFEPNILLCRAPTLPGEGPLRAYYADLRRAAQAHRGRFAQISDTTHLHHHVSSALERKLHADLSNEIAKEIGDKCVLCSVVIRSPIIRAATTAVLWLLRLPMPVETAATFGEALARARAALSRLDRGDS